MIYDHDLIIGRGKVRKRKKAPSRKFRGAYGHTPLSAEEDIPWRCRRLVIGTGADGALPVMQQVPDEARRRKIDLIILPTAQAIGMLTQTTKDTNAILHLTCCRRRRRRWNVYWLPPGFFYAGEGACGRTTRKELEG